MTILIDTRKSLHADHKTAHNMPTRDMPASTSMVDTYGRHISYLRLSVTDRCDLRCTYCMPEKMRFLPKSELLSLDELDRLASGFIAKGVRKLRITGGEPLVRKDILSLIQNLSRHLKSGQLDELTLTTNGTQLSKFALELAQANIKRINVSIDSLDPGRFKRLTRGGDLTQVLTGIRAAQDAGLQIKLNTVALRDENIEELPEMITWAHRQNMDFTLIEVMPMGQIESDRINQYISLKDVQQILEQKLDFILDDYRSGGPARYYNIAQTGGRLGLITPLSHNFCGACNRIRVTCTGQLYTCLGQNGVTNLRHIMRHNPNDDQALYRAIDQAIRHKPEGHDFEITRAGSAPTIARHMSMTGG